MPLLDHFHPPLSLRRKWEGIHSLWAGAITASLNAGLLPRDHFAEPQVSVGRVEVDVATQHEEGQGQGNAIPPATPPPSGGEVATLAARAWAPPTPAFEMDAVFPGEVEVLVISTVAGPTLVGAIELVSPSSKDRPASRRAFAMKCLSYFQAGVGVLVVDVVTERNANLHDEMAGLLLGEAPGFPGSPATYAAACRPFRRSAGERIAVWPQPLAVGQPLPEIPLWLRDLEDPIRIDLEASYTEARQRCRID